MLFFFCRQCFPPRLVDLATQAILVAQQRTLLAQSVEQRKFFSALTAPGKDQETLITDLLTEMNNSHISSVYQTMAFFLKNSAKLAGISSEDVSLYEEDASSPRYCTLQNSYTLRFVLITRKRCNVRTVRL